MKLPLWVPNNIIQLRKLSAQGSTATEIANALGMTRNAILGKCRRLGIRLGRKRP